MTRLVPSLMRVFLQDKAHGLGLSERLLGGEQDTGPRKRNKARFLGFCNIQVLKEIELISLTRNDEIEHN